MKKTLTVVLCGVVMLVTSVSFAADVVVTKRGKKYHLPNCGLIKGKETAVLDEKQAQTRGLKPCPVCLKDKVKNIDTKESNQKVENKKDQK